MKDIGERYGWKISVQVV